MQQLMEEEEKKEELYREDSNKSIKEK